MFSRDRTSPDSLRNRAFTAGSWSMIALVSTQGIRFGGNLIMTRLLVPEMFGIMAIATTVSVVLALLSDIGLRQNIIQSRRGDDPVFLNTAWTVQIVRGFILYAASLLVAALVWAAQLASLWSADTTYASPVLPLVLAITGLSAIIAGFQSTKIATAFRSFQQKKVVLIEIAAQILSLMVMLGIGYFTRSIWALVAAGLFASAVSTVLSHIWLDGWRNRLQWDSSSVKELIAFGRWILLSSAVGVLAMNGDRIWFGGSMTVTDMGVYSIAILILGAMETGVQRLAGSVILPALSEAARVEDPVRLSTLYYRLRLAVDISILFACGFLFTASPMVISFLYDDRYYRAGEMLAILSLAIFFWRFTVAHQAWLALGLTKYQAIDNLIRFASLWGLMPLLLALGGPAYALWGIALHALPTLVLIVYVNRRLGLFDVWRELAVLPTLAVGALVGMLMTAIIVGL